MYEALALLGLALASLCWVFGIGYMECRRRERDDKALKEMVRDFFKQNHPHLDEKTIELELDPISQSSRAADQRESAQWIINRWDGATDDDV